MVHAGWPSRVVHPLFSSGGNTCPSPTLTSALKGQKLGRSLVQEVTLECYTEGCLCSDVRISTLGRPDRVGLCHCLDCRKHHGALFGAMAMFSNEAVTIEGEARGYANGFFCPDCGSSVFMRSGTEVAIHLGALDAPDQLIPSYESWMVRRERWLPPFHSSRTIAIARAHPGSKIM
jgi:hypothetical protein